MDSSPQSCTNGIFPPTRWSMVVAAGDDASRAGPALAGLCQLYWPPLYAYLRHKGHRRAEAEDLVQDFFVMLMEKSTLIAANPDRGRFRSFLITALKNFTANRWDYDRAKKRGGDLLRISLDFASAEETYQLALTDSLTPERAYDRQWAIDLLTSTLDLLRREYEANGKIVLFEHLSPYLNGDADGTGCAKAAMAMGLSVDAAKMAASRLRTRYRAIIRQKIADTVDSPADVDTEIRDLFAALSVER